ncbi:MAG: alpha-(1-_3)-arabinofuranosyltransferase family protein [Ilumatobacter sp.]|nr:alpha-(1->3)-arabinofuranosyltransferase family protein [Ilumatobacter sp.]
MTIISAERLTRALRVRSTVVSVAVLALLAYLPALTASPGRMPADSKLFIYLDPGRFIADTTSSFDPRQYAGWVPHQHIAYLWPTAPWFWTFERLGVPDWVAHRLWIGTLLLLAGLGVRWMSRVLGLAPLAALTAALVYQLSPYVLPYISRTSVLLLPWAGLGWIVGLTVIASVRGRWRFAAGIALVVLTVGAVNATALLMIVPAPALWLVHAAWHGTISWRRAWATAGKVVLLSSAVSLWWMTMLVIQGRRGADVLAYSESLESVSFTSTSTEVARGLGYWLFYIRDSFAATTTASIDHLISTKVVFAGLLLASISLFGLLATRWPHRRYAGLLVGFGVVIAVGVHPIDEASPLMSLLVGDRESGLALALRSSTRAVPVVMLGMALGAATLVEAVRSSPLRPIGGRRGALACATAISLVAAYNLPALRNGGFVDPALERDQDPPQAWLDAARMLDAAPQGYRVLQLPGGEFGAFQWGYTVDQPLPSLTDRPVLTRDLLPLGSAAAMDLIFALDDRVQDGTVNVQSIAPVARLLGVDTVWVADDVQYDRFRLARPELVDDLLTGTTSGEAALSAPARFGEPSVMPPQVAYIDEQSLGDPRVGLPLATVSLVGIEDPIPTVRVKEEVIVLSGSGDGIVDAAAAGLVDGSQLIRYSASLGDDAAPALETAQMVIVTDSNRDRAHHWRSSQDVHGATESGGPDADVRRFNAADQRLPIFDIDIEQLAETQTVAVQDGPVQAFSSAYGEPFAYLPEHRPVMAVDGDPTTSWLVADRFTATGEFIELHVDDSIDHIALRQPDMMPGARTITRVEIDIDDAQSDPMVVVLDDRSLTGTGQRIDIAPTGGPSVVTITIVGTSDPQPPVAEAIGAVGFAEIGVGLAPTVEYIRPPIDAASVAPPETALSFVFNRLRADPQDRFRSDPEPVLRRRFEVATPRMFDADITLRVPGAANGDLLSRLLAEPVTESGHLAGTPTARGAAAFDGSTQTSWITPFDEAVGASIGLAGTGTATEIEIVQPVGDFAPITRIRVTDRSGSAEIDVNPESPSTLMLPRPFDLAGLTITIVAVDERLTIDRRFGEPFGLPAAISEVMFEGRTAGVTTTDRLDAECRRDLLTLDGEPIAISFDVATADALAGRPINASVCDPPRLLNGGTHELASTAGTATGFDVDTVVLTDGAPPTVGARDRTVDPAATVLVDSSRQARTVEVPPCPRGCWVVLGEGFNLGWAASANGTGLGKPQLVDGNANGWWLQPTQMTTNVTMTWTPQRALTIALLVSLLAALVMVAIVVVDRRRDDDTEMTDHPPRFVWRAEPNSGHDIALLIVATGAAALLIGWTWALPALVVTGLGLVLKRPRLAGAAGLLIVVGSSAVVTGVVLLERPFPNAGWPMRFEWLHGWTLLGILLIACSTVFDRDQERLGGAPSGEAAE